MKLLKIAGQIAYKFQNPCAISDQIAIHCEQQMRVPCSDDEVLPATMLNPNHLMVKKGQLVAIVGPVFTYANLQIIL